MSEITTTGQVATLIQESADAQEMRTALQNTLQRVEVDGVTLYGRRGRPAAG